MTRPQQAGAHARAADGDDAHLLVVAVAQLGAQLGAIAEVGGVEAASRSR